MSSKPNRVAFCGTRGIPANYGGFETAVDEITKRFVDSGVECDVVCRGSSGPDRPVSLAGRNLVYVKGSRSRTLDTFVSAIQTGWFLLKNRRRHAHVFWFNNANFPGILMTWLAMIPMSVNTDGLEWRRAKWSWPFKAYYVISSFVISLICKRLISDSYAIQRYYRKHFFARSTMIPYGAPNPPEVRAADESSILNRFGLQAGKYFLQITRFEPDNLPAETVKAFVESKLAAKGFKMIVVGFKDETDYALKVKSLERCDGVIISAAIYDAKVLAVLRANCYCYVHGNSVGGTNPALLEAMSGSPRIMAIDCEFSREVLGPLGLYFDPKNIAPTFYESLGRPAQGSELAHRVYGQYQWSAVAEAYMQMATKGKAVYRPANVIVASRTLVGTK